MAGRKKGSGNATPEQKRAALSAWVGLGTAEKAAEKTGHPVGSLYGWRSKHGELWKEVEAEHAQEVRERHSANVRCMWDLAFRGALKAAEMLQAGQFENARDLRQLNAVMLDFAARGDHAMRLDSGDPTSIREDRRSDAELLAALELAADRAGVTLDLPEIDPSVVSHTGGERH